MYSLKVILLEGCYYCIELKKILDEKFIESNVIEYTNVTYEEKEQYKNNEIKTFPQVYLVNDKQKYLIGGYDIMKQIIDIIDIENHKKIIKKLKNILDNWPDRIKLQLILLLKNVMKK